jgi:hypothetical protein
MSTLRSSAAEKPEPMRSFVAEDVEARAHLQQPLNAEPLVSGPSTKDSKYEEQIMIPSSPE